MSAGVARAGREPVVTARGVASAGLRDFDFADGSGGAAMKFSVSFASVALLILVLPLMWVRPGGARPNGAQSSSSQSPIKTIYPTFTTIDVPGAGLTEVSGINAKGDMVGFYGATSSDPHQHGFLLKRGRFIHVDYPHAYATLPLGVNDAGLIVGTAELRGGLAAMGFTYDGKKFTNFHDGDGGSTIAYRMNNSGEIVGGAGSLYTTAGFEETNRIFTPINFPGNNAYAWASGINNLGQIVGFTINGLYSDCYSYINGQFQNLDVPGSTQTSGFSINDKGIVVGYYFLDPSYYGFALLGRQYDSFSYPGAVGGTYAHGINISGQVVGQYSMDGETYHGFLTSPITGADFQ